MAEPRFDRDRFAAALATMRLGRTLDVREATDSTNDDAWAQLLAGGPDGLAVLALAQRRGRGRAGRRWEHSPGLGLALSFALRLEPREAGAAGLLPLAAGLAVADALASLGAAPRLKWPNDVLLDGRKAAGVLCELRRLPVGDAVVVGVGINVGQREADFPGAIRATATSLAAAGIDAPLEAVAAGVANALERRRTQLREGDRAGVLRAWSAAAAFWGEPVTVRGPGGEVTGIAMRLEDSGALVLRLEGGVERAVVAGDVLAAGTAAGAP